MREVRRDESNKLFRRMEQAKRGLILDDDDYEKGEGKWEGPYRDGCKM
jgi:hypothetical protein